MVMVRDTTLLQHKCPSVTLLEYFMTNRSMTTKFVLELSVLPSHQTSKAISHAQPTIAHKYQFGGGSNPGGGGGW